MNDIQRQESIDIDVYLINLVNASREAGFCRGKNIDDEDANNREDLALQKVRVVIKSLSLQTGSKMAEILKPCETPCSKCGSDDINRQFYSKGDTARAPEYGGKLNKYFANRSGTWHIEAVRDHIHNHCQCCHFRWPSLPMKKQTKK